MLKSEKNKLLLGISMSLLFMGIRMLGGKVKYMKLSNGRRSFEGQLRGLEGIEGF